MRRWSIATLFLAVALAAFLLGLRPVDAHGKEVRIDLHCAAADPSSPLDLRCQATVVAANDGDPVEDARFKLSALRQGKGDSVSADEIGPTDEPGQYLAQLALPAYGTWVITAEMLAPAEGSVRLSKEVLPPSAGATSLASDARANLIIGFKLRDLANLVALGAHLLGAIGLFGSTAAVLVVRLISEGRLAFRSRRLVARLFPWAAGSSLALLALSGAYNALYNAPTRSPGLLKPENVASLPFGEAYLIAFAVKMGLGLALLAGTVSLAWQLRRSENWRLPAIAGGSEAALPNYARMPLLALLRAESCVSLAVTNLLLGGAILIDVLVIDYLHLLSHAAALSG